MKSLRELFRRQFLALPPPTCGAQATVSIVMTVFSALSTTYLRTAKRSEWCHDGTRRRSPGARFAGFLARRSFVVVSIN